MSYYSELAYEEWEQANLICDDEEPEQEETAGEPEEPAPIPQPAEPEPKPAPIPRPAKPQPKPQPKSQPKPVPAPTPAPDPAPIQEDDEAARRQAHEAAEAKRRAEWDAAQEKKRAEEQAQIDRVARMGKDELRAAAMRRISSATDKMTNRSMKDSVSAHIQSVCERDLSFARLAMHPKKSMLHCIQYIFRHAKDYLKKELEAGGIKQGGMYGGDVPDGLCYQWAEDYFRDPDAAEDKEKEEFKPRPYISHKPAASKPAPKPAPKPKGYMDGQISLLGEAS